MKKTIMEEFFERRFGKDHPHDSYFGEWVQRFATGHPENYMDNESLIQYASVLLEKGQECLEKGFQGKREQEAMAMVEEEAENLVADSKRDD